jgi:hypothetical protein
LSQVVKVSPLQPAVQGTTHDPPLQTLPVAQVSPSLTGVLVSTQLPPVAQEILPATQWFGLLVHDMPSTQLVAQVPPLQEFPGTQLWPAQQV